LLSGLSNFDFLSALIYALVSHQFKPRYSRHEAPFNNSRNEKAEAVMKTTILGSLIGAFILIVCGIAAAQAEIKVGIAGPLSGSSLDLGETQEIGAQKAFEHLNDKGGLLGTEIVVISVDDACEPRQAKAVARQLVSEGVVFVVGHICSSCSLAASKIYEKSGIIMISPGSTNPKVTDEGGPNVFRVIGRDDQQGTIAGDYLANNHSKSNIAIIHDGQAYGLGLAEFTKLQLNKRGVTEVMFDSYTADKKDYKSIVNKLVNKKIDVLYAGGYLTDIGIILRQAKKERYAPKAGGRRRRCCHSRRGCLRTRRLYLI
jgi:branched-chain amino acid transport system substrate-binding protein